MFTSKTVFILGAGASWHYGYPTGEELVRQILRKAVILANFCEISVNPLNVHRPNYIARNTRQPPGGSDRQEEWRLTGSECRELISRIDEVNPLVVDYFLGQNAPLQELGRLLIAWAILECEAKYVQYKKNINRGSGDGQSAQKDNWVRFVLYELAARCKKSRDLMENDVRFITFNYDVSLEAALYRGLRSIHLFESDDVDQFLSGDRIIHVYGKVGEPYSATITPTDFDLFSINMFEHIQQNDLAGQRNNVQVAFKTFLDAAYLASQGLKVIDPSDKDSQEIAVARQLISEAQRLYLLGYGFDENNNISLGLPKALHCGSSKKSVCFTNFKDINRVNKRASKVFFGGKDHFPPGGPSVETPREAYYEKSVRDVYEALELDFDLVD
jgi:hypothetical protein